MDPERLNNSTHLFEMVHEMIKVCCSELLEELQVKGSMHLVVEDEQTRREHPVTNGFGQPTRGSSLSQTSASMRRI